MKVTVEQITPERAEEVLLRCHDPKEPWVEEIQSIAAGQITVNGMADGKLCRLKLGDKTADRLKLNTPWNICIIYL